MMDIQNARIATLAMLAERSPGLGRTALMKFCYFLQVIRDVPLGYRFTLYSYGPFDSGVLSDLASAESLGVVHSEMVLYSKGYGYEIKPARSAESVKVSSSNFVKQYECDVNWVIDRFAKYGAGDLELMSTIVYVDQEALESNERMPLEVLVQKVYEIKPHFKKVFIQDKVEELRELRILRNLVAPAGAASA